MKQIYNPKVSVIIPVYNAEKYLQQCLNSVLSQSLKEIEVICVDDGSKDSSLAILRQYEKQDSRVTVVTQQNQFAGVARNKGMTIAKGDYYAFLDADDYFDINGLEKLYRTAKELNLDVVKAKSYILNEETQEVIIDPYYTFAAFGRKNFNRIIDFKSKPAKALSLADVPWNGLYKATFLKQNGIQFNHLRCVNDRSFFIHCMLKAERVLVSDSFLCCYRVNMKQSLVGIRNSHFECQIQSYHIIRQICIDCISEYFEMIMRRELDNLFYWRKRIINQGCVIENEKEIFKEFFDLFDLSDVGEKYIKRAPYYYDFLFLKQQIYSDSVLRRKAQKIYAQIYRGMRICKDYGLGYILGRLLHK